MAMISDVEIMGKFGDRLKKVVKNVKENRAEKKAAKSGGGNESLAVKALTKKFGSKFTNATPAQKKQLITMIFAPIPPITKRLLMLRVLNKGALDMKKVGKAALRVATGGASILAEKVAARAKARKAERAAIENQTEESAQEESFDESISEAPTLVSRGRPSPVKRSGRRGSSGSSASINTTIDESGVSTSAVDGKQLISKSKMKSMNVGGMDIKKMLIPAVAVGAGILFFMNSKKKK